MQKDLLKIKGVNPPKTKLGLSKMKALLDASRELFTKVGFFETSVSDICKHANTAVGTFYIYFESKTDVYRLLLEEYKKEIKAQLAKSIANCSTRKQKERERRQNNIFPLQEQEEKNEFKIDNTQQLEQKHLS